PPRPGAAERTARARLRRAPPRGAALGDVVLPAAADPRPRPRGAPGRNPGGAGRTAHAFGTPRPGPDPGGANRRAAARLPAPLAYRPGGGRTGRPAAGGPPVRPRRHG